MPKLKEPSQAGVDPDENLKRMLKMPHKEHAPLKAKKPTASLAKAPKRKKAPAGS